jgi:hypothetical protein
VHGKNGKPQLMKNIKGIQRGGPALALDDLVDLDRDVECAPPLCEKWVPQPGPYLCFRVAVREVEAWLMADSESLASFLKVARHRVPPHPEQLLEPKTEMVISLGAHDQGTFAKTWCREKAAADRWGGLCLRMIRIC